jgi:4-hydroxy-tetrahydrodipicolinate reductase
MSRIRVLHFGLGPIGLAIVKQIVNRPGFLVVGAVDVDPAKAGRDLGEVAGLPRRLRVVVQRDAVKALKAAKPDVVVHCTSSSLVHVTPQLETILRSNTSIVSTTEELAYPMRIHARHARRLDALARKHKARILATGVNPGFAMDALPVALTAVCERVDRVTVRRVQDARIRRLPFQIKIGAGLTREQFLKKVQDGSVRHVGFAQSITMIADALGWKLDRMTDEVKPRMADATVASDLLAVDAGDVCGIVQDGVGYRREEPVIQLHLEAYLGAPETYDAVEIEGSPKLSMKFAGGIHGDIATASMVVNAIPKVLAAAPGLHTMRDLPLPSFFPGSAAQ